MSETNEPQIGDEFQLRGMIKKLPDGTTEPLSCAESMEWHLIETPKQLHAVHYWHFPFRKRQHVAFDSLNQDPTAWLAHTLKEIVGEHGQ